MPDQLIAESKEPPRQPKGSVPRGMAILAAVVSSITTGAVGAAIGSRTEFNVLITSLTNFGGLGMLGGVLFYLHNNSLKEFRSTILAITAANMRESKLARSDFLRSLESVENKTETGINVLSERVEMNSREIARLRHGLNNFATALTMTDKMRPVDPIRSVQDEADEAARREGGGS